MARGVWHKRPMARKARVEIAGAVIRARTVVSTGWAARELNMGHFSRVNRCWPDGDAKDEWSEKLKAALR